MWGDRIREAIAVQELEDVTTQIYTHMQQHKFFSMVIVFLLGSPNDHFTMFLLVSWADSVNKTQNGLGIWFVFIQAWTDVFILIQSCLCSFCGTGHDNDDKWCMCRICCVLRCIYSRQKSTHTHMNLPQMWHRSFSHWWLSGLVHRRVSSLGLNWFIMRSRPKQNRATRNALCPERKPSMWKSHVH